MIKYIKETKKIMRIDGQTKYEKDGKWLDIDEKSQVSMNFWGFTPDIFEHVEKGFAQFLKNPDTDLIKDEYYIPDVIEMGISEGAFNVKVIETNAVWKGVTYKTDKPAFMEFLDEKIEKGEYPENLWGI